MQLVRLQSFDGSFQPSENLAQILGQHVLEESKRIGVSGVVWATVVAIAYLQKHFRHEPELLQGLVEKAAGYITRVPGVEFKQLVERAQALIS